MTGLKPKYYKYLDKNSMKLKKDAPKWAKDEWAKDEQDYNKRMFGKQTPKRK